MQLAMRNSSALRQLAALLRREPPETVDWFGVLALANHALLTPALAVALQNNSALPVDVQVFLSEVLKRNIERNRRLKAQLVDALRSLNVVGIQPVLLKGAILLASTERDDGGRILGDLDILLRPEEVARGVAALEDGGFRVSRLFRQADSHVAAELGRPEDVGIVDLHRRPPGPLACLNHVVIEDHCHTIIITGARASVPSSTLQILLLVAHDQFHDQDYWRGRLDLRHLLDFASLTSGSHDVDWDLLVDWIPGGLMRTALDTHLIAAEALMGARAPRWSHRGLWSRWQYYRRLLQMDHPRLGFTMLALSTLVEWPAMIAHFIRDRSLRRELSGVATRPAHRVEDGLNWLRHLKHLFRPAPPGKS
jgi:hypothetical protein